MLSIISGAIVFICASYVGIEIRRHYKRRVKLMTDISDFFMALIGNLSFSREPINIFAARFIDGKKGDINSILTAYLESLSNTTELNIKTTLLKKSEISYLTEVLTAIGKTNLLMETKRAETAKLHYDGLIKSSQRELDTNGKLAYKLGVLFGLALMVLLV